ncbi:MAG: PHP domain-containing protein [Acidobacteria bacterium]|nr:PHP domain-containing protein [Acidobacteriota bacterium]
MKIDLHVHSNRSDGAFPPAEVVRLAREAGLGAIALTDHDTAEGVDEARAAGDSLGVEVLTGAEISTRIERWSVHMLAYLFDPARPDLARTLRLVREGRVERARGMVEKLRALGVAVTFERVRELAKGEGIARPHVAQAMVEAGVIGNPNEAFTKEWIGTGGRAYVDKYSPTPLETVRLVAGAGGVTVLAHPIWLANEGLDEEGLIEELAAAGLAGVEVDHPDQDEAARRRYREIAKRLDLVPTGASDWHGNVHGGRIGECTTEPEALERLRARARGSAR